MQNVSDSLSNANDQIARAAKIIGRSKDKAAVFGAVYYGKKKFKSVDDIVEATGMTRKRVLEDAAKLANQHLFAKSRQDGEIVYERDMFIAANKRMILSIAGNAAKLAKLPTKTNPTGGGKAFVTTRFPRRRVQVRHVTVDEIDSFSAVRNQPSAAMKLVGVSETAFKEGIQRIIGEAGTFKDWGGERNDLLSTRLIYKKRRCRVAFAFKGPGKGGKLTPGKMGKNGNQIQKLFESNTDFYVLQYWNQIDESVTDQMQQLAIAKSFLEDREIFVVVIDGADSARLFAAYPQKFKKPVRGRGKRTSTSR